MYIVRHEPLTFRLPFGGHDIPWKRLKIGPQQYSCRIFLYIPQKYVCTVHDNAVHICTVVLYMQVYAPPLLVMVQDHAVPSCTAVEYVSTLPNCVLLYTAMLYTDIQRPYF